VLRLSQQAALEPKEDPLEDGNYVVVDERSPEIVAVLRFCRPP
jgi:hypothetical protein